MKKAIIALLTALCLVWLTGCAHMNQSSTGKTQAAPAISRILERGELIVGTAGSMPPLNMTTKDGKVIGLEPDLAASIAGAMGVKLTIKTMDFPELLLALSRGEVDMVLSGMTMTPKRNLKVAFVGPYYVSGKSLLTKYETLARIEDASQLNSPETKLTALENSTSQVFVEKVIPKSTLITAKNYDEAVDLLLSNEAQALIADFPICAVSVLRYPKEDFIALAKPMTFEPIGIAISGDDHLMVNWLENFLGVVNAAGEMDRLKKKWFTQDNWLDKLP